MATALPASFKPAFTRIQQSGDFDCAFACIAMLTNKPLAEIKQQAIDKFRHPKHGPYWISETLISSLLASHKLVATVYKEYAEPLPVLPDVAILMVDYEPVTEVGRHVIFHRGVLTDGKGAQSKLEYVIDPAYWADASNHVRSDWKALKPAWYIGVTQMKA